MKKRRCKEAKEKKKKIQWCVKVRNRGLKMAGDDEATNGAGGADGEEESGKNGKSAGEDAKKRRGRPPKPRAGAKGEDKNAGSLEKYLDTSKLGTEIVKGKELQRTPVRQNAKDELTTEEKKNDGKKKEDKMAAAQRGEKRTEEESSGAEEEDERAKRDAVSASENAALYEWMDGLGEIVRKMEERLEWVTDAAKAKDYEIKALREECRCRDLVVEGLQRRLAEVIATVGSYKVRIEELEMAKRKGLVCVGDAGEGGGREGGVSMQRRRAIMQCGDDAEASAEKGGTRD